MPKISIVVPFALVSSFFAIDSQAQLSGEKSVRCVTPAFDWQDGMVSGNGLIGTLHHGAARDETTVFNCHKFIVPNGAPHAIPNLADQLEPMRDLMLAGKIGEGYQLYHDAMLRRRGLEVVRKRYHGMVASQMFHGGYQMKLSVDGDGAVKDYARMTDYQTGEVITAWRDSHGDWSRKSFASRSSNVLVSTLSPPAGHRMTCRLQMQPVPKTPDEITFDWKPSPGAYHVAATYAPVGQQQAGYEGVTRIVTDGRQSVEGTQIVIRDASRILLLTTLDRYRTLEEKWPEGTLTKKLSGLPTEYDALLQPHVAIHRPMFNRVEYSLLASQDQLELDNETLLADEIKDTATVNKALIEKIFYTSRYLFMASSGQDYAPRLTGIFTGEWKAAWAGDYTCDANVNLAVLGGNIVDLPECMEGYFQILGRTLPQWREAARNYFGCRGIVGPIRIDGKYANNIHCGPYHAHMTATSLGPWLVYPMYEHFLVTGDRDFLRDRVHPLLRQMAIFYEDFLTRKDEAGHVIFVPSNSPENADPRISPRTSAAINATVDIAAAKHALRMLLATENILGIADPNDTQRWQRLLDQMPPYLVNSDNALKEWAWESIGENYGHRHCSHMYTVWPAYEINPENDTTSELLPAVRNALVQRGIGFKQAHDGLMKAVSWLRVKDGEKFFQILKTLLEQGHFFDSLATSHDADLHIYNYDAILCLQGLLVESALFTTEDCIELLPALPKAFARGRIRGIKGRNQTTVEEFIWDCEKQTIKLNLNSRIDQDVRLILRRGFDLIELDGESMNHAIDGEIYARLKLKAGVSHELSIRFMRGHAPITP